MIQSNQDQNLLSFEEKAHANIIAFYTHKKRFTGIFEGINKQYITLFEYFETSAYEKENYCCLFFINRCHSAFLGAGRMALSCQFQESEMLIRGILENAIYSFFVALSPEYGSLWLNRDVDKKKMKNIFKIGNMFRKLKTTDEHIYNLVSNSYELAIDFGAHPNPFGSFAVTTTEHNENRQLFYYEYLTRNRKVVDFLHLQLLDAGYQSLLVLQIIFKDLFETLRIDKAIKQLAKEIDTYRKEH